MNSVERIDQAFEEEHSNPPEWESIFKEWKRQSELIRPYVDIRIAGKSVPVAQWGSDVCKMFSNLFEKAGDRFAMALASPETMDKEVSFALSDLYVVLRAIHAEGGDFREIFRRLPWDEKGHGSQT